MVAGEIRATGDARATRISGRAQIGRDNADHIALCTTDGSTPAETCQDLEPSEATSVIDYEAVPGKRSAPDERDAALVRQLKEGAPAAAQELCDRFGPKLFAYAAARFAGDREVAKDLMVQSLAQAARNIRSFNPKKATLTTWLYGIARQRTWYELRQRMRQKSIPASAQLSLEALSGAPDNRDMAAEVLARVEAKRQIAHLAAALSGIEFEVLVLSCLDDFSAREIGQIVGRSERAVHSLLHRARMKARERLAEDE
jgi:RNA polymerase sigma-70 factor (ECF subfamily)